MAEYIERASAVHAINSKHRPKNSVAQNRLLALAVHDVFKIPAADVAPVRHERWISVSVSGIQHYRCTGCGEYIEGTWTANFEYRYCPNCGARMKGSEEDA